MSDTFFDAEAIKREIARQAKGKTLDVACGKCGRKMQIVNLTLDEPGQVELKCPNPDCGV